MLQGHESGFRQTDAVFAGQGPFQRDGQLKEFFNGFLDPTDLIRIIAVVENLGMEVAVPGMAEGGDLQAMPERQWLLSP